MFRRILSLSLLIAAVFAGSAGAEPKNQAPFTRLVVPSTVDLAPLPEAKNVMPFTRAIRTDVEARPEAKNELPFTRQVGADSATASSSSGIDWTLTAWVALAAITLAGGGLAASRLRVGMHKPA
jgi:hypothetical protein